MRFFKIVVISIIGLNLTAFFYESLTTPKARSLTKVPFLFGDMPDKATIEFNNPIVRLAMPDGSCSAWVVDKHYAVTAAHCIVDYDFRTKLKALSETGSLIDDNIHAMGYDSKFDLGLLMGDFSKVRPLKVNFEREGFFIKGTHKYIACGYPLAQQHLVCTNFTPQRTVYFQIMGRGHLISGMSGGPVIDLTTGEAVAVNAAVDGDGNAIVSPVEGFLGLFHLEY